MLNLAVHINQVQLLILICFVFLDTPRISLTMTQTLDGDLIRKGDTVYLHCEVKANPAAHTVEWTRDEVNNRFNINAYLVKNHGKKHLKKDMKHVCFHS